MVVEIEIISFGIIFIVQQQIASTDNNRTPFEIYSCDCSTKPTEVESNKIDRQLTEDPLFRKPHDTSQGMTEQTPRPMSSSGPVAATADVSGGRHLLGRLWCHQNTINNTIISVLVFNIEVFQLKFKKK